MWGRNEFRLLYPDPEKKHNKKWKEIIKNVPSVDPSLWKGKKKNTKKGGNCAPSLSWRAQPFLLQRQRKKIQKQYQREHIVRVLVQIVKHVTRKTCLPCR